MNNFKNSGLNRRSFFQVSGGWAGVWAAASARADDGSKANGAGSGALTGGGASGSKLKTPVSAGRTETFVPEGEELSYRPVVTLNNATLPWKRVNGVKIYHLVAESVEHEFAKGLQAECWGFSGRVHGPTIEAVEGDRVRIYVTNRLPAPTVVHWHGLFLPCGMDGVGGLTQKTIRPGETFKYEFTLRQHGTYMYHAHHDEMTQMQLGMLGLFIIHPRVRPADAPDRDYALLLSEWRVPAGARRPDPIEMTDFNIFSVNGRAFPGTSPLLARTGERVRIRVGNLSTMSHHAIHLHGYAFQVVATDGGEIPVAGRWPETTVFVPTGSTRTVEFVASEPGDWAMHCHMLHHVMTQMGHGIGNWVGIETEGLNRKIRKLIPGYMVMGADGMGDMGEMADHMPMPPNSLPMVGAPGPHDYITMGGMFAILKVRDQLPAGGADPGWYEMPAGSRADVAGEEELRRDGILVGATADRPEAARAGATKSVLDPTCGIPGLVNNGQPGVGQFLRPGG